MVYKSGILYIQKTHVKHYQNKHKMDCWEGGGCNVKTCMLKVPTGMSPWKHGPVFSGRNRWHNMSVHKTGTKSVLQDPQASPQYCHRPPTQWPAVDILIHKVGPVPWCWFSRKVVSGLCLLQFLFSWLKRSRIRVRSDNMASPAGLVGEYSGRWVQGSTSIIPQRKSWGCRGWWHWLACG